MRNDTADAPAATFREYLQERQRQLLAEIIKILARWIRRQTAPLPEKPASE